MAKVVVDIAGKRPYDVRVAPGILQNLGEALRRLDRNPKALIITDLEVAKHYLNATKASLEDAGYHCSVITVPSGEEAKSVECAAEIWNAMADCKLNRDSLVVALGGGVIGDLAGFTGSTFMRGLPVVQVPTTLLSMVDSSVGGKTAINLEAGKNLVGTFCQPLYVCADIETLQTLPEREWACGCAEIAKSALIDSDDFFFWLCEHADQLAARNADVVQEAVVKSVVFKAQVVAADEQETKGVRECLNYGHTLAHAIETEAGYGVYSHGAAVAEGMRFAARLGVACCGTPLALVETQDHLLDELGLPALDLQADPERLLDLMFSDKKVRSNTLRFVLPRDVGDWEVVSLEPDVVLEHLRAWQQSLSCADQA
ncbi:3-dehydroquinate synthase [Anaerotardibacter muris]|uniref:3-dehydroquinate synthase n=1 Tax=Anaerotardibacter muris TaxID=2941505 RepID=UPI00204123C1|nr:3-dehydroquinate synthase [Anaerotardibacter muris]